MKTIAKYMRASQEDANLGESATIQNQRDLLDKFLRDRPEFAGWNVLEFQDDGWSGTTLERPGVQKLLAMAGKSVDCILVKDFSRFGRNLIEVGNYLDQVFPFLGVRFIAVNEEYDSVQNEGHTVGLGVSLRAMSYEMYSRDLSKKISSVKAAQIRAGNHLGRVAFFGYRKSSDEKNRLTIDEEAARTVRLIFSLAADGKKPSQIAVLLNEKGVHPPSHYRAEKYPDTCGGVQRISEFTVWSRDMVREIIKDERYTGCIIGHKRTRVDILSKETMRRPMEEWIRAEHAQEAIISRILYEQAQAVLERGRNHEQLLTPSDLFRGILKCAVCGKALRKFPCGAQPYYQCMTGKYAPSLPCAHIHIDRAFLEQLVLTSLQVGMQLILNEGKETAVTAPQVSVQEQPADMEAKIKKQQNANRLLFERMANGELDEETYILKKSMTRQKISELERRREIFRQKRQNNETLCKMAPGKPPIVLKLTHELLAQTIQKICVFEKSKIEIVWRFKDTEQFVFLCRS